MCVTTSTGTRCWPVPSSRSPTGTSSLKHHQQPRVTSCASPPARWHARTQNLWVQCFEQTVSSCRVVGTERGTPPSTPRRCVWAHVFDKYSETLVLLQCFQFDVRGVSQFYGLWRQKYLVDSCCMIEDCRLIYHRVISFLLTNVDVPRLVPDGTHVTYRLHVIIWDNPGCDVRLCDYLPESLVSAHKCALVFTSTYRPLEFERLTLYLLIPRT